MLNRQRIHSPARAHAGRKPSRGLVTVVFLACATLTVACGVSENERMSEPALNEVLNRHTAELMAVPGVVAVGESVCDGAPCIKVYVAEPTPELPARIPDNLEGYPVVVEESGEIRPLE